MKIVPIFLSFCLLIGCEDVSTPGEKLNYEFPGVVHKSPYYELTEVTGYPLHSGNAKSENYSIDYTPFVSD